MKNVKKEKLRIKRLLENKKPRGNKIPFDRFLPKRIDFEYNEDVHNLINYIENEGELLSFSEKNLTESYIFLNPTSENYSSFLAFDCLKFLVFLKREGVITNLYLPLFAEKRNSIDNKKITIVEFSPSLIDDPESFIRISLETEKSLRPYVINFKVRDWQKFSEIKDKLEKRNKEKMALFNKKGGEEILKIGETFEIQVRDRYIWIKNYLLSKPHAVGSNLEFFEYIRSQPKNIKIERNRLPDFGGSCLKKDIQNKGFIKILNGLGFKGEILKAYFPKRGKNMLIYRGDKITKKDLEKAGVKIPLFLKELEVAHLKNSPE